MGAVNTPIRPNNVRGIMPNTFSSRYGKEISTKNTAHMMNTSLNGITELPKTEEEDAILRNQNAKMKNGRIVKSAGKNKVLIICRGVDHRKLNKPRLF